MTRGIVLDVDDTLYLERDYVRSGFAAVGRHLEQSHGIHGFCDVAWQLFEDGHRGKVFDDALERMGVDPSQVDIAQLVDLYRGHAPDIALLPDSAAVLHQLEHAGTPLAVITDGPAVSQHAKVRALGLVDLVEIVVVTADLGPGRGKPHEAAFRLVEEALGLAGDDLVYVADNPVKDFVAPARRGWGTVRVRRAGSLHEAVDSGPDVEVEVRDMTTLELT